MAISFKSALGVSEPALLLRARRAAVLSDNLANADTPHYKARDIDFRQAIARATGGGLMRPDVNLQRTHDRHLPGNMKMPGHDEKFRIPQQPAIDGNTVEEQVEHAAFMENALDFQATFQFLNSRFKGLTSALKGE